MLTEQKSACDGMIDEKNKLIHDFQQVNKFQYLSSVFVSTTFKYRKYSVLCEYIQSHCLCLNLKKIIRPVNMYVKALLIIPFN